MGGMVYRQIAFPLISLRIVGVMEPAHLVTLCFGLGNHGLSIRNLVILDIEIC